MEIKIKIALFLCFLIAACAMTENKVFYAIGLGLAPIAMFLAIWHGRKKAIEFGKELWKIIKKLYLRMD
jgi:hypothetical protein